jgi:lipoate---protein ligase
MSSPVDSSNGHPNGSLVGRLIPCFTAPGKLQMQIDRWLLQEYLAHRQPPTLRFYQWSPVAISLGYHQRRYPAAWQSLSYQGEPIDLVRRPTGGRAVLHQGELTYSIVTAGISGSKLVAYQQLCEFLIRGWQSLGVELTYGAKGKEYRDQADCFATATGADLVLSDGYKFIGSAQLIRDGALLQHGSMRLQPNLDLFKTVFGVTTAAPPAEVQAHSIAKVTAAITAAAAEVLNINWQVQPLSGAELTEIQASS